MFGQRKKREAAAEEGSASLAHAFNQLDLFGGRLDALKRSYNEQAKALAAPSPPASERELPSNGMLQTPVDAFQLPLPPARPEPPKPNGRYAVARPPAERPGQTKSGRYYLQLAQAADVEAMRKVREDVSKCGRVVDSGQGTASDPQAGWLEVAVRAEDTGSFIVKLEELGVKAQVEKVIEVSPGEGRLQARQFDLFRKKQDSGSGI